MFKTYFIAILCLFIAAECLRRARGIPAEPMRHVPCHDLTGFRVTPEEVAAEKAKEVALAATDDEEQRRLRTFEQSRAVQS